MVKQQTVNQGKSIKKLISITKNIKSQELFAESIILLRLEEYDKFI